MRHTGGMAKSYYAGMDIDAPCGRCKSETTHRILSITNGVPEKIICATCKSVHKFREDKPVKAVSTRTSVSSSAPRTPRATVAGASASAKAATAPSPSRFQELMIAEQGGAKARAYSVAVSWEEGAWLDHPSFGLGKVQKRTGKKIEVLFREGLKTLITS